MFETIYTVHEDVPRRLHSILDIRWIGANRTSKSNGQLPGRCMLALDTPNLIYESLDVLIWRCGFNRDWINRTNQRTLDIRFILVRHKHWRGQPTDWDKVVWLTETGKIYKCVDLIKKKNTVREWPCWEEYGARWVTALRSYSVILVWVYPSMERNSNVLCRISSGIPTNNDKTTAYCGHQNYTDDIPEDVGCFHSCQSMSSWSNSFRSDAADWVSINHV